MVLAFVLVLSTVKGGACRKPKHCVAGVLSSNHTTTDRIRVLQSNRQQHQKVCNWKPNSLVSHCIEFRGSWEKVGDERSRWHV